MPQAPEVPTAAEAIGRPDFAAVLWHAVFVPPGLPAPVLARLSEATNAALGDPAFRAQLAAAGIEAEAPGSPDSAAAFIAAEVARYRPIVEALRPELDG
jgi:tripartite-type tricarboxylate transporter receptor subunit TctC